MLPIILSKTNLSPIGRESYYFSKVKQKISKNPTNYGKTVTRTVYFIEKREKYVVLRTGYFKFNF
ncbi:hypothetical protein D778_01548 [Xanthomarina gelatinilytica]|uniref:Uncharacterized protein n=1 Tax=Xanthomarina gelatinilytica TaxID=1137281 RepID=M7NAZ8_9FLAO|nr:hypothetical protein D778_01548 [Xanthomarina gelatinilytica]